MKYLYLLALVPLFAFGAGCSTSTDDVALTSDNSDATTQDDSMMDGESADDSAMEEEAGDDSAMEESDGSVEESLETYSMEEVAKHTSEDDCWFVIDGKVYDVSGFGEKHGGGEAVYEGCGKDATELFETRPMGSGTPHSDKARSFLPNFEIGILEFDEPVE